METAAYPTPDVLVARLAGIALPPEGPPSEEFLRDLAGRVGLDGSDLLVIAGLPLPAEALNLEGTAGSWVRPCLMSGVCKAASTIRMVRYGAKALDAELLDGFAAVLGVPVAVLASLTGVRSSARGDGPSPEVADVAALIREVRHLTEDQVRELAEALDHG
ncbi:hypothetical protein [Streptomyces sp. 1268]|uniref:hypothetical protein n=1 Tax=Streptomyces sp. 1268 TaxID=3231942 RepID=UPI0038D35FD8